MSADAKNKKDVIDWINTIRAGGNTEPYPAVKLALDAEPALIQLLSDGEFDLYHVQQIKQANPKPIRIDCYGLGEYIKTLYEISQQHNDGTYTDIR